VGATRKAGTASFFKQRGGFRKKSNNRRYRGRTLDEMPRTAAMSLEAAHHATLPCVFSCEILAMGLREGNAVNWGRGLFRLWVIFSALWIAGLSAIFIVDAHLLEPNKTYEIEGRFKEKYELVAPPNFSPEEVVAFAQKNQRTDCSENKRGPWCDYPVKLEMPRKAPGLTMLYVAIGVPAGALLIGGGFFWALSGFRRTA